MGNSYNIPDYDGKVIFGLIKKSGKIETMEGENSQTHIEIFGANNIKNCDRFRIIDDDIYITYRDSRTREDINVILLESFPGKKIKKYKILVASILNENRRRTIDRICETEGIGPYLAGVTSGLIEGD